MTTQCFCVSERSVKETARGFGEFVGWSDIYRNTDGTLFQNGFGSICNFQY